jgi:hypothetical protein
MPAALPRRIAGWALLAIGALMLLAAVATAAKYDFRDRDVLMKIIGTFILPAVAIAAGSALTRGKLAVDGSPDDGKLGSKV